MTVLQIKVKLIWLMIAVLIVVVGAGSWMAMASRESDIGVIDSTIIESKYIIPLLQGPLEKEQQKLQQEFDSKSKNLSDTAKQNLFNEYQERLSNKENELLGEVLSKMQSAIDKVAIETGISIVVDKTAVHWGGVDITTQVLAKLGVK